MIQKIFHIDKWWGRTIFIILTYAIFWCIFYGALFFVSEDFFELNNISGNVTLIYALLIVPVISFYLIKFFKKYFLMKNFSFYLIHIIYLILSITLFLYLLVMGALQNANYGGF